MKNVLVPVCRLACLVSLGFTVLFLGSLPEGAISPLLALPAAAVCGFLARAFYCSAERIQRRAIRANARAMRRRMRVDLRRSSLVAIDGGRRKTSVA